ncbi:MAG: DUF1040 family protein [Bacteroidetes bacterium]|jgi:uncharacterized protein YihD (DUF1040 family)|nr:DUF1040 family protein [Bacteroidota bacterium]
MRNPDRIQPTLDKLAEIWKENPDFRLGQLIMVIAMTGEHNPKLFYMEDDVFLKQLDERKTQLKKNE